MRLLTETWDVVDHEFLEADQTLEALCTDLRYAASGHSVTQNREHLEALYHRSDAVTRYKVLTELIDIEYSGVRPLLLEALRYDDSALVRHEAAFGLGLLGDGTCVNALIEALLDDENLMVRHEAAIALAEVGGEEALEALEKASHEQQAEVATSAKFAIQNIRLKLYHRSGDFQ